MKEMRHQIEADIERYSAMLERFKSRRAKTGDVDSQGRLTDETPAMISHLERIISELRSLLKAWSD